MIDKYNHSSGALSVLNNESLEEIGSRAMANINSDLSMTRRQKRAAIRELDSLLKYERRRRQRLMQWQWEDESLERDMTIAQKTFTLVNKLALERKETMLKIAHINAQIINFKVTSIERIRNLQKDDPRTAEIKKIKHEFLKLKIRRTMQNSMRAEAEGDLEDRIFRRARFQQKAQEEFPDDMDEIMDDYDRASFESRSGGQQ